MNLTTNQLREIDLLIESQKSLLTESVEGVAKVAKMIQLYLGCKFNEAVRVLGIFLEESI